MKLGYVNDNLVMDRANDMSLITGQRLVNDRRLEIAVSGL